MFNHSIMNDLFVWQQAVPTLCKFRGLLFCSSSIKTTGWQIYSLCVLNERNCIVHVFYLPFFLCSFMCLCKSASESFLQISLNSSKWWQTSFVGLTGNLSLGVQDYNLCKPLVNGKVLIHSKAKCSRVELWLWEIWKWPIQPKTNKFNKE